MPTRRRLHTAAILLDRELDRRRGRPAGTAVIQPYRGLGRDGELVVRGRVLLEKQITRVNAAEPVWRNVVNTWRRFLTDEIAGARVVATYGQIAGEAITDEEGYFRIVLHVPSLPRDVLWHEVQLSLPETGAKATAHVLVPTISTEFAVLSDIDDTVVVTNATSLLGMARSVIRNAASRLPFEGVADLYSALHRQRNPLFYVSSSPWNLYDLLHDFMDLNGIPHGPMFLQDWGIDETTLILASHQTHKMAQIQVTHHLLPGSPLRAHRRQRTTRSRDLPAGDSGASRSNRRGIHPGRDCRSERPGGGEDPRGVECRWRRDALRSRLVRGDVACSKARAGLTVTTAPDHSGTHVCR